MIKVNVILNNINWRKYLRNPQALIKQKIKLLNNRNNFFANNTLIFSLILSGTQEVKDLNKKFRKKNKSTDVLSFPFYEKNSLIKKMQKKEKEIFIGDIVINLGRIKKKNSKIHFEKQLHKLWIHGLVHLFGHQHNKDKDFNNMSKLEKKYLDCIS